MPTEILRVWCEVDGKPRTGGEMSQMYRMREDNYCPESTRNHCRTTCYRGCQRDPLGLEAIDFDAATVPALSWFIEE